KQLPTRAGRDNPRGKIDMDATALCLLAYTLAAWRNIDEDCAKPAELNQVVAHYVMGQVNETGSGRAKDPDKAYQWYRRAAAAGLPRAQNALGRMLMRGLGTTASATGGANWVRRAAKQGYPPAQFNLGYMHQQGLGVERHRVAAANWYRHAAVQGHARAQYNLATRIMAADGLPRDPVQAYKWLLLAEIPQGVDQKEGPELARRSRRAQRLLAATMTPAQLDKAHAQATEFRPKVAP
ncbi:MAG: sel1 repeat family protein, partial [Rhodospirillaceae bacterium]|nr:sel1 repeat family protein [Rhodospirillaceae bacterium]